MTDEFQRIVNTYWDAHAQGIAAGTDETPKVAQPEGQEPGPKDAPSTNKGTEDQTHESH